jgi:Predicted nucleotide-binding protein containing TIR-like domain
MAEQNSKQGKPKVFIGSSSLAIEVAREIQIKLKKEADSTVWDQEDWLGKSTLEHLMHILKDYDFAILVFQPNDVVEIKGEKMVATRDNVIFELGLFMGRLGREKVFIVLPSNPEDEHLKTRIPSDLLGINFAMYSADSEADLEATCSIIRKRMLQIWSKEQSKVSDSSEVSPLIYEAGMLYRILNAASSPQYKPIDSDLLKPFPNAIEELSFANIEDVRVIAEELFYYYMFPHLKFDEKESQRLRVYFAYYLGDGAPLKGGIEPIYCIGKDEDEKPFNGPFVIGISNTDQTDEKNWMSGLPLKGYEDDDAIEGRALSNAAEAFRRAQSRSIENTEEKLPSFFKHLNFKVKNEKTVYSVPVVLSKKKWTELETQAPIGILTISGSHPGMIDGNIKKRADHLAILLGFIFYLHGQQNPDDPDVEKDIGVNKIPVGFRQGSTAGFPEFVRRTVSLRREIAKHFEEYFIKEKIHKREGDKVFYIQSDS